MSLILDTENYSLQIAESYRSLAIIHSSVERISKRLSKLTKKTSTVKRLVKCESKKFPKDVNAINRRQKVLLTSYNKLISSIKKFSSSKKEIKSPAEAEAADVIVINDDDTDDVVSSVNTEQQQQQQQQTSPPVDPNIAFMNVLRTCPVCQESMKAESMVAASCSHWICYECFKKLPSKRCPLCNIEMEMCIRYKLNGTNICFSNEPIVPYEYCASEIDPPDNDMNYDDDDVATVADDDDDDDYNVQSSYSDIDSLEFDTDEEEERDIFTISDTEEITDALNREIERVSRSEDSQDEYNSNNESEGDRLYSINEESRAIHRELSSLSTRINIRNNRNGSVEDSLTVNISTNTSRRRPTILRRSNRTQ